MSGKPYHRLEVWRQAHQFVLEIYQVTDKFPTEEKYGLTSQLRRAAVSVPTNIVEGHAKRTRADFLRFLDTAKGSLTECEYLLELARDLGYLAGDSYELLESSRGQLAFVLYRFIGSMKPQNP